MNSFKGKAGLAAATIMSIALAGCVSFGAKPPPQLLSLTAEHSAPAGEARTIAPGSGITVVTPDAVQKLATARIPVQVDDASVAYVKKAMWVDAPRRIFAGLMVETLKAAGTPVVDSDHFAQSPGRQLSGTLLDFGVDARTNTAVVTFDAVLSKPGGGAIETRRFTATAPVGGDIEATSAARAINGAANKVAMDVTAWIGGKT